MSNPDLYSRSPQALPISFLPRTMDTLYPGIVLCLAALCGGILLYKFVAEPNKQLPPGPRRTPLVGNALQIPQVTPWKTFSEWTKKYGDLMHVDIFGRPMAIISSAKVAKDLLDKRSLIYSNRPHFVMAGELAGYDGSFVLQQYGENWRQQRKLIAQELGQGRANRYHPLQEKEARTLIRNILEDASTLESQIKLRIGTIIIRVTYGYYISDENDPLLTVPLVAMANFSEATAPGNFLVDFIPMLKHMPRWMPGSGFLRKAEEWRRVVWESTRNPYYWSKANLETGAALTPNICGTVIQDANGELTEEEETRLIWATSTVMGGGLDTNMSTALTFFLAMITHPEVQKKAHEEIISAVGSNRLPTIADKDSLPYVRSVITEVLRWNPAVPLGIPHALSQDDVYDSWFLPKDTLLMPNVWHMFHDPEVYDDPLAFNPERYNNDDSEMRKITDLAFGFGRRACPGFYFAEGTLYAIVLTALTCCEILPELDDEGKPIIPNVTYTPGSISFPGPFQVRLKPRSLRAVEMLEETTDLRITE
ncbi:putative monooxygenase [Crucibulum laeve]|uniref:Putative monooxygenase n=1 Tax=Crucibulum laeve TaxID=68775 RepID=A0A5C3LM14_9AGAR|nr:putative monooxygenase [Crucibulum laeve]